MAELIIGPRLIGRSLSVSLHDGVVSHGVIMGIVYDTEEQTEASKKIYNVVLVKEIVYLLIELDNGLLITRSIQHVTLDKLEGGAE